MNEQKFFFAESLALRGDSAERAWIPGFSLFNLGRTLILQGELERAEKILRESWVLHRDLGDSWRTAYSLLHLGYVPLLQGKIEQALSLFRESLVLLRQQDDKFGIRYAVWGLAAVAALQSEPERCVRLVGAIDHLGEIIGHGLPPGHRPIFELFMEMVHAQLDETAFTAAWSEGRAMTIEEAIAYALEQMPG